MSVINTKFLLIVLEFAPSSLLQGHVSEHKQFSSYITCLWKTFPFSFSRFNFFIDYKLLNTFIVWEICESNLYYRYQDYDINLHK